MSSSSEIRGVYTEMQRQIEAIMGELKNQSVEGFIEAAALIEAPKNAVENDLKGLEENGEWDRFTIAFYGETNAGKSTVIEALRIALKEKTKLEAQEKFKSLCAELEKRTHFEGDFWEFAENLEATIAATKRDLAQKKGDLSAFLGEIESRISAEQAGLEAALTLHEANKRASFFYRIKVFFKTKSVAEILKTIDNLRANLALLEGEKRAKQTSAEAEICALEKRLPELEALRKEFNAKLVVLQKWRDGAIISQQTDYTKEVVTYHFANERGDFDLLDVPGIEGKEAEVLDEIKRATQKAHLVFYITKDDHAPQSGDKEHGKIGTLEKIKQGLGKQAEVWTLYNKQAREISGFSQVLLPQKDREAIDAVMRGTLKEHYRGTLCVSGRLAFEGLAECLASAKERKNRRELLEEAGGLEVLLELSGFSDFCKKLTTDLAADGDTKIIISNYNKAKETLSSILLVSLQNAIEKCRNTTNEIRTFGKTCCGNLERAIEGLRADLTRVGESCLEKFAAQVRTRIYAKIDEDISNDEAKRSLAAIIEAEQESLKSNMESGATKAGEAFKKSAEGEIDGFKKRSSKALENLNLQVAAFNAENVSLGEMSVKSSGSVAGLLGSAVGVGGGIAFLASNPVGWAAGFILGVLGLAAGIIGVVKSFLPFFSSESKKANQKEAANKAIAEIGKKIKESLATHLAQEIDKQNEGVEKLQNQIEDAIKSCEESVERLEDCEGRLRALERELENKIKDAKCKKP